VLIIKRKGEVGILSSGILEIRELLKKSHAPYLHLRKGVAFLLVPGIKCPRPGIAYNLKTKNNF
jgi:hypothetical protein